jgi:hypothetical protein
VSVSASSWRIERKPEIAFCERGQLCNIRRARG